MKKVVILTSVEHRHTFLRKAIALDSNIEVLRTYCEDKSKDIIITLEKNDNDELQIRHIAQRNQSEKDFFAAFNRLTPDKSNPVVIEKGDINKEEYIQEVIDLNPDLILAYGCSIIKPPLVEHFHRRFLNVHLGLSPYYRGSGTNFFPLVNGEPEFVGATFMYIDEGIDTGNIIHQIRAEVCAGDTPHSIGNRLIADVAAYYIKVVNSFDRLEDTIQPPDIKDGLLYKKADFTPEATRKLYQNFAEGMVDKYLEIKDEDKAPLYTNPAIKEKE